MCCRKQTITFYDPYYLNGMPSQCWINVSMSIFSISSTWKIEQFKIAIELDDIAVKVGNAGNAWGYKFHFTSLSPSVMSLMPFFFSVSASFAFTSISLFLSQSCTEAGAEESAFLSITTICGHLCHAMCLFRDIFPPSGARRTRFWPRRLTHTHTNFMSCLCPMVGDG